MLTDARLLALDLSSVAVGDGLSPRARLYSFIDLLLRFSANPCKHLIRGRLGRGDREQRLLTCGVNLLVGMSTSLLQVYLQLVDCFSSRHSVG